MNRNVSADSLKFRCNILISGKIIKEMPGSVVSGTHTHTHTHTYIYIYIYIKHEAGLMNALYKIITTIVLYCTGAVIGVDAVGS